MLRNDFKRDKVKLRQYQGKPHASCTNFKSFSDYFLLYTKIVRHFDSHEKLRSTIHALHSSFCPSNFSSPPVTSPSLSIPIEMEAKGHVRWQAYLKLPISQDFKMPGLALSVAKYSWVRRLCSSSRSLILSLYPSGICPPLM
jgi:hypothetical protein